MSSNRLVGLVLIVGAGGCGSASSPCWLDLEPTECEADCPIEWSCTLTKSTGAQQTSDISVLFVMQNVSGNDFEEVDFRTQYYLTHVDTLKPVDEWEAASSTDYDWQRELNSWPDGDVQTVELEVSSSEEERINPAWCNISVVLSCEYSLNLVGTGNN